MKEQDHISKRNQFIKTIIESIQMTVSDFMLNLASEESYEKNIYCWSISLFEERKSIDEAIKIVHRRRMSVLLSCTNEFDMKNKISLHRQKVMNKLKLEPTYCKLSKSQKRYFQDSIDRYIETDLYSYPEIVEMTLALIKRTLSEHPSKSIIPSSPKQKKNLTNTKTNLISKCQKYLEPMLLLNKTMLRSS